MKIIVVDPGKNEVKSFCFFKQWHSRIRELISFKI